MFAEPDEGRVRAGVCLGPCRPASCLRDLGPVHPALRPWHRPGALRVSWKPSSPVFAEKETSAAGLKVGIRVQLVPDGVWFPAQLGNVGVGTRRGGGVDTISLALPAHCPWGALWPRALGAGA